MPTSINGVRQMPLSGVSMAYTLTDANAPTRKHQQEFEMLGSRAIWKDGWTAVAWHQQGSPYEEDKWELFHTDLDFSQTHDLAATMPEKMKELRVAFDEQAKVNGLLPLDDRAGARTPGAPDPGLGRADTSALPIQPDRSRRSRSRNTSTIPEPRSFIPSPHRSCSASPT